MPVIGELETVPRFVLERHQIAQVICQVRFSPVLRLQQQTEVVPFQEEIRDRYPGFSAERAVGFLITPQGVVQQDTGAQNYRFIDQEHGVMLVLGTDFVAIETRSYVEIEDIVTRMTEAVELTARLYQPPQRSRVGLRFTNEFRFESTDLSSRVRAAFTPAILGPAGTDELASATEGTQSVLRLRSSAGNLLQVLHGLNPQGGTTVPPIAAWPVPSIPQEPFYLLDLDAYSEFLSLGRE